MNEKDLAFHYVCTLERAREIVKSHENFWVSNCGCRENREQCERSRIDICLLFRDDISASDTGKKEISKVEVEDILQEAKEKHLVTRPFRNEMNMNETNGICFCCDDCCEYFLYPDKNKCDKGTLIQSRNPDKCSNCGVCVEVCYFGARNMENNLLIINHNACYGCGLCVDVCPENCIKMVLKD